MIEALCRKLTALWCRQGTISDSDAEVYRYGLELLVSTAVNFAGIVLISFLMRKPLYWIPYLLSFIPCRVFGGGYHSRTHLGCILFTSVLYLSAVLCTDMIPLSWIPTACIAVSSLALVLLFLHAPAAAENKPLTASERKFYGRITLAAGTVILCLALIYNLVHNLVSARTMMIFVCGEGTMVISMIVAAITSAAKKTDLNITFPQ